MLLVGKFRLWTAPMVCSRQSIGWGGLWRSCPSCQIFGAARFEPKRSFLDSPRERRCSCAVDTSDLAHRRQTAKKKDHPNLLPVLGKFGSRAGTTNCDASGLGGFVRRYLSTRNPRITSNFFRCTMYLVSHSVLCHCLVKQHSRNDKKKKKKKDCQMSVYHMHKADPGELSSLTWFSESHTSHGRARHQIRDWSESGRSRELLTPGTSDSCRPRGVVTRDFRPFLSVCLTVFPFEFRPRTFTIGFYGKKYFISELMILECSFPLTSCTHLPHCSRISYTTHSSHGTNLTSISTHTSTSKHCTSWIVYKTHTLFLAVFSSWWSSNRAKRRNFLPFLSHQPCLSFFFLFLHSGFNFFLLSLSICLSVFSG